MNKAMKDIENIITNFKVCLHYVKLVDPVFAYEVGKEGTTKSKCFEAFNL